MSADKLRQAAKVLRERAEKATPGPWGVANEIDGVRAGQPTVVVATRPGDRYARRVVSVGQTRPHLRPSAPNVAYIATMHPGVGLALAKWLDDLAAGWQWDEGEPVYDPGGHEITLDESMDTHPLAIADLILGGA